MPRFLVLVVLAALGFGVASAAPAPADLFTVTGIRIDATAESAIAARDLAMAQGRPLAFTEMFRRFTATANWPREPQLSDNALLRLIRAFEVANERRSTTRYLADVTYHFNPVAVRAMFRQAGIPYTETRSRPALVIPLLAGMPGFDPASPWAQAWAEPSLQLGLVPFLVPALEGEDAALFIEPDLTLLDWTALEPLARRHGADDVIIAIASEDARTVRMVELSMNGRGAFSFAYAQSTFAADAKAAAERAFETYKTRNAIDYSTRARIIADVQFDSLADWARIRAQLAQVRMIADVDVIGLAVNEAEISLTHFGRPEQLQDALADENLELINVRGLFTLHRARQATANAP